MRINSVLSNKISYINTKNNIKSFPNNKKCVLNESDHCCYYNNYVNNSQNIKTHSVIFMGHIVHIIDGGTHATNMQHFMKAIKNDADLVMHNVEVNFSNKNVKQLKSLEKELKNLNAQKESFLGEYVAIPASASVPILNIQDQFNRIMDKNVSFTPENLKANKKNLLLFLKNIYENPSINRTYINYMDSCGQGIEYTYGVIQQINKLKEKGAKVYIPAGHPQDNTLKWMADYRGLKPELYNFIATGKDVDNVIGKMRNEIKDKNWYDFNLLSLSDANIVGLKDKTGINDYIFSAYDSCITDGARGVYNFSPVRQEEKIIGYSYTDTYSNEYPFEEFPANDEVADLVKFVGKDASKVLATNKEVQNFKNCILEKKSTDDCPDKLYPVKSVFTESQMLRNKILLKGDYVDKSLKLFFRENENGKIIFPQCDCEGSGKPSVLSMWGCCFAVFNAIARDIKISDNINLPKDICSTEELIKTHKKMIDDYLSCADFFGKNGSVKLAEDYYNHIIDIDKAFAAEIPQWQLRFEPHYLLGNLHFKSGDFKNSAYCYNNGIDIISSQIIKNYKSFSNLRKYSDNYINSKRHSNEYNIAVHKFNQLSFLFQMFTSYPQKPYDYNEYFKYQKYNKAYSELVPPLYTMFENLAEICKVKGEEKASTVCMWAALKIKNCDTIVDKIIERRKDKVQYMGDLYNENM